MPGPLTKDHLAPKVRIGIVGTGFIAVGLCMALTHTPDLTVSRVYTRRLETKIASLDSAKLTNSLDDLLSHSDLIVECSGDVNHACRVVEGAHQRGLPVVTMAAEFHVTAGSYFCQSGMLTEAEGDQPGALALLNEEALDMGFRPQVFGNIKGFLNKNPNPQEMEYWAKRNGISRSKVTSFTDGTKIQIEQALVANGLNAKIARQGLIGPSGLPLQEAGNLLGAKATELGSPISDYVLSSDLPPGVFITAEHPTENPDVLRYLKLGDGPYYTLVRPYHLCHLEIPRTIRRVLAGKPPLLNNGVNPTANVMAIAKRDLNLGHTIECAIGGDDLRGEAVAIANEPDAAPIGLLDNAVLKNSVEAGQPIRLSDVEIPGGPAFTAWQNLRSKMAAAAVTNSLTGSLTNT